MSDDLIARLGDENVNERKKALARLVQERASGPLVRALDSGDAEIRAQAARGLSEIADPATADRLAAATEDEQAEVRAFAAVGLARIDDPRAVDALVKTIDELQDPLHYPYTAAVYALEAIGEPAVPAVVAAPQRRRPEHPPPRAGRPERGRPRVRGLGRRPVGRLRQLTRPVAAHSSARDRGRPIIAVVPSSRIGRCSSAGCWTRIATTSSTPSPSADSPSCS